MSSACRLETHGTSASRLTAIAVGPGFAECEKGKENVCDIPL